MKYISVKECITMAKTKKRRRENVAKDIENAHYSYTMEAVKSHYWMFSREEIEDCDDGFPELDRDKYPDNRVFGLIPEDYEAHRQGDEQMLHKNIREAGKVKHLATTYERAKVKRASQANLCNRDYQWMMSIESRDGYVLPPIDTMMKLMAQGHIKIELTDTGKKIAEREAKGSLAMNFVGKNIKI